MKTFLCAAALVFVALPSIATAQSDETAIAAPADDSLEHIRRIDRDRDAQLGALRRQQNRLAREKTEMKKAIKIQDGLVAHPRNPPSVAGSQPPPTAAATPSAPRPRATRCVGLCPPGAPGR